MAKQPGRPPKLYRAESQSFGEEAARMLEKAFNDGVARGYEDGLEEGRDLGLARGFELCEAVISKERVALAQRAQAREEKKRAVLVDLGKLKSNGEPNQTPVRPERETERPQDDEETQRLRDTIERLPGGKLDPANSPSQGS